MLMLAFHDLKFDGLEAIKEKKTTMWLLHGSMVMWHGHMVGVNMAPIPHGTCRLLHVLGMS